MRADHHRAFLHRCLQAKITPKRLRLGRRVNPIRGVGTTNTANRIKEILKKAEEGIVHTLIDHYENLIESTTNQREDIE